MAETKKPDKPAVPEIKEPEQPKPAIKKAGIKAPEVIEPEELPKLKKIGGQVHYDCGKKEAGNLAQILTHLQFTQMHSH